MRRITHWRMDGRVVRCPVCGTGVTRVTSTRTPEGQGLVKRRHECGNYHTYLTFQLYESTVRDVGLTRIQQLAATSVRGVDARAKTFWRKKRIDQLLKQGVPVAQIAVEVDLTDMRVRQIRAELAGESVIKNTPTNPSTNKHFA